MFELELSRAAVKTLSKLERYDKVAHAAVQKALGTLQINPDHSGLNTHPWRGKKCPHDKTLFESYAQNGSGSAYRIFWCYKPDSEPTIVVAEISPHK